MRRSLNLNPSKRISGLYAITPDFTDLAMLLPLIEAAIAGGASVLQYRNKMQAPHIENIQSLAALSREKNIFCIANDSLQLAQYADGVHLGKDDSDIALARQRLGANKIIGVSCYNSLERAMVAEEAGADYVAFGSMFDSTTKPDAPRATLELLREARSRLKIPIVAIGGITLQNAHEVAAAGADAAAVINAVFAATDVYRAAQAFSNIFNIDADHHESQPTTL
ncbi:MAG TPA: thiamine phosphate synthase [Methylophilaceae bacterium]|jgi:thiamine-phosphate pyrophosphorylase